MSKSVWKPFYDAQKEERWLNHMSAKGLALTKYTWMHYRFEDSAPGEYVYRIELLDKDFKSKESLAYIDFLKQNDIEYVTSYMRWVYLRKKAADGPFEVYSDNDSKLGYVKRLSNFYLTFGLVLVAMAIAQLTWIIPGIGSGQHYWIANAVGLVVAGVCGGVLLSIWSRYHHQIDRLKRDKVVYD